MAFISVSSYTNRVSEGTELQGCQALKLEQLMYSHLANGCRQLAYMDYLIVLTSDLVHVHVSLKEHIYSAVHTKRSLPAMTVDRI